MCSPVGCHDDLGGVWLGFLWFSTLRRIHATLPRSFRSAATSLASGHRSRLRRQPVADPHSPQRVKGRSLQKGVNIVIGQTDTDICPVGARLAYLARRGVAPRLLFVFKNGSSSSRTALVDHVCTVLRSQGISAGRYSGHSFRIGAVTAAAAAGIEDLTIRSLGRWKSDAYTGYIRMEPRDMAGFLQRLALS